MTTHPTNTQNRPKTVALGKIIDTAGETTAAKHWKIATFATPVTSSLKILRILANNHHLKEYTKEITINYAYIIIIAITWLTWWGSALQIGINLWGITSPQKTLSATKMTHQQPEKMPSWLFWGIIALGSIGIQRTAYCAFNKKSIYISPSLVKEYKGLLDNYDTETGQFYQTITNTINSLIAMLQEANNARVQLIANGVPTNSEQIQALEQTIQAYETKLNQYTADLKRE